MQKLVTKYKNDDVEFFFINTWEREEDPLVLENVSKFIKENNYTFNVLFDFDDEIITKYKVQGIPTKIVIDKNGNIISINSSEDNIDALIKESIE
jgi:peroxiredoxin